MQVNRQQDQFISYSRHQSLRRAGRNRGVNLPFPYFLSQFLPPPYFLFPHPGPSSSILPTTNFSFSPSSLLFPLFLPPPNFFWAISPSSLLCSSPSQNWFHLRMTVSGRTLTPVKNCATFIFILVLGTMQTEVLDLTYWRRITCLGQIQTWPEMASSSDNPSVHKCTQTDGSVVQTNYRPG